MKIWICCLFIFGAVACKEAGDPSAGTDKTASSTAQKNTPPGTPTAVHALKASELANSAPLVIAYSDWPGWVAWDIAREKGFFRDAGVSVKLTWLEYGKSMEVFSEGKADAVCMTNGDALVSASSGAQSVGVLLNDFSNGNDMIVAQPDIASIADLKGKKVGVEVGFVDHLLLLEALKSVGLKESDVQVVNTKTNDLPQLLKSGAVSAIAAWQPNSGQALELVPGSKAIFTSANAPGLIYDLLFVSPKSLKERRDDWKKVIAVWLRVASYIEDPKTRSDAVAIMSRRVGLPSDKYARLTEGTFILNAEGNRKHFAKGPTLTSVFGSSATVDQFNVSNHIYKDPAGVDATLDPSLLLEVVAGH
jgi:NitT/TauT family transport system substrate-binding protein